MKRIASLVAALALAVLIPSAALADAPLGIIGTTCSGLTGMPGTVAFNGVPQGTIVTVEPGDYQSGPNSQGIVEFYTLWPGTYTWESIQQVSNTLILVESGTFSIVNCPTPPPTGTTAPIAPQSPSTPFGIVAGIFVGGLLVVVLLGKRR